jgi:hypothetical protein
MKIELVKQTKPDGVTWYTNTDGRYVDGSLELTEEKARVNFEFIKAHGGKLIFDEIIETIEL